MRAVQRMWWQWGKPRPTVNVIKLAGVISDRWLLARLHLPSAGILIASSDLLLACLA
jgi:hypothetical protein